MCYILILTAWGAGFNMIAIQNNGGLMPVYQDPATHSRVNYTADSSHFYFYNISEVKKWYLTDIINLGFIGVASIGDMFLFTSIFFLLFYAVKLRKQAKREGYN